MMGTSSSSTAGKKPCLRKKRPPPAWWHRYVLCCCTTKEKAQPARRVTYDEVQIRQQSEEAGVLYATEKIPEVPTPFLLYDSHLSRTDNAVVEIGEGKIKNNIDIGELQTRLGILELRQQ